MDALQDKVAIINGASRGMGAAIARELAANDYHVALMSNGGGAEALADDILQRKLRSLGNVDVITNALTKEVVGDGRLATGLRYEDRATGELQDLAVAGIFVQIGLLPNTDWLKGTVELTRTGEIVVDARGQTSAPGIFAAGDVTTRLVSRRRVAGTAMARAFTASRVSCAYGWT